MATNDEQELASLLRRLASWEIHSKTDLKPWYDGAKQVCEWLKVSRAVTPPPELWHWLADADIRFKSSEYAKVQNEFIQSYIRELES